MKKILFWIIAFLWIWLSFCSADWIYRSPDDKLTSVKFPWSDSWITYEAYYHWFSSWYLDSSSPNYLSWYYYQFWNIYSFWKSWNNVVTLTNSLSISPYPPTPPYFNTDIAYYFSDYNKSIYPKSPYLEQSLFYYSSIYSWYQFQWPCDIWYHIVNYSDISFMSNNYQSLWYTDSDFCTDFFNLPVWWDRREIYFDLVSNTPKIRNTYDRFVYIVWWLSNSTSAASLSSYSISCVPGYWSFWTNRVTFNYQRELFPLFCFKDTPVEPDYTWRVITWDIIEAPSNPKFKINYWNTSYEYEIDWSNDVEIHLKSPVVMSWSYNYVYDWPIWINLFYNNTSQFYDKDKLYLKSMYWYNYNIFTPICL